MSISWNDLKFKKNPFFLKALTDSELKFFGDRKSEVAGMVEKIKQGSLPFVLEGDVGSGKTTLVMKVANELMGDDGTKLAETKCLLVIVNSDDIYKQNLRTVALSKLMYFILTDKRLSDVREKVKNADINGLPPQLSRVDDATSDLMERFEISHMSFEDLVALVSNGGKVIFVLDDLDKIDDDDEQKKFAKSWRHSVQEIYGVSTIYVGNYGLDGFLKGVSGFFAHAPTQMTNINKEDLEDILNERVSILSNAKYPSIDYFIEKKVWSLFHEVNRGERLRWILQTLSRVIEGHMSKVDDPKTPIRYGSLIDTIKEYSDNALNVPYILIPITNKLIEIFWDSIEYLTIGELTDDNWKSVGVWRGHNGLVGGEVVVDGVIEKLPGTPQTIGAYLSELERLRFLASKTIKKRKYYLPADDFMLFLKMGL